MNRCTPAAIATAAVTAAAAAALPAAGGTECVEIDLAGMTIDCEFVGPCAEDQSRNSAPAALPTAAGGYSYTVDGVISSSGVLGAIVPSGSTLAELFDILEPGSSRLLNGFTRNFQGDAPLNVYINPFNSEFAGIDVGMTIQVRLDEAGVAFVELVDINIPGLLLLGDITIEQGDGSVCLWTPPEPSQNEWRFDDGFAQADGAPGAAKLRFLDDPAFGPVLGGQESNLDEPQPGTPTGVSEAQSAFGATAGFGIAPIDGEEANVLRVTPPRNLDAPNDPDLRRGVGLAMWPNTQPAFPGGIHGQYTIIYDLYIPAESWFEDFPANTQPREWLASLLHDNHNNDNEAALVIRWNGAVATIGYDQAPGDFTPAPQIQPDQWFRLAWVCDLSQTATGRLFVNGQPIGDPPSDWVYNGVDGTDPRYGDDTPVDPADWAAWGEFPSPWAQSPAGGEPPAPLAGTVPLFADLAGRGEAVYLAALYWTDTLLSDQAVAEIGGPDAAGIVFTDAAPPCPGDVDGDHDADSADLNLLLAAFGCDGGGCSADLDDDGDTDSADLNLLLAAFGGVCE